MTPLPTLQQQTKIDAATCVAAAADEVGGPRHQQGVTAGWLGSSMVQLLQAVAALATTVQQQQQMSWDAIATGRMLQPGGLAAWCSCYRLRLHWTQLCSSSSR
jgi:hypothetical protein